MKPYFAAIQILILLLLGFNSGALASEKSYVISYSPSTPIHLLVRDRVKAAYERAGLKAEFIPLPHNRSLLSASQGNVDGDVGRIPEIIKKFPDLRRVDEIVMDFKGFAYVVDPAIEAYQPDQLEKYRVGAVLGVQWSKYEQAGLKSIEAPDVKSLFEMLLQGRLDMILVTEQSALSVMNELGSRARNVKKLEPVVISSPFYHYVHKKNTDIIPRLEAAIKAINDEGVYVFYTGVQSPIFEILEGRLKEAFARIGKLCEVRPTGSSQRALVMANENGDGDAYRNGRIKTINPATTGNLLQITEPIGDVKFSVYTTRDGLEVTDWSSLSGLKNGLRVGAKILEKNIPAEQTSLPDTDRLMMMLAEKRLDTVTEHETIADFKIKQLGLKGIKKLEPALASFPGYSYIHKKHQVLLPAISASLAEMKSDGSYQEIEENVLQNLLRNAK